MPAVDFCDSPSLFSSEGPNKFFSVSQPPPNDEWSTLRSFCEFFFITIE